MNDVRFKYSADTRDLERVIGLWDKLDKEEQDLLKSLRQVNAESNKTSKTLADSAANASRNTKGTINDLKGMGNVVNSLGGLFAGAFAAGQLLDFGKKVIDVTSQFQKLQAVLTNALGSQQAGEIAFQKISSAASKTNFSVLELTDTYVKFANRGLRLTSEELFNLTDLANSTGKSIDQLTEATLDAFSGENERLKEFGITAKKTGETTQFTFKGITTEVKNTQDAIREYIVGLGDLEGVSGSTAAISATLEGRLSNLGDALDGLFFTIGSAGSSSFSQFIGFLTASIQAIDRLIQGTDELRRKQGLKELGDDAEKLPKLLEETAKGYEALGLSAEEAKQKAKDFLIQDASENLARTKKELSDVKDNIEIINGLEKGLIENQLEILGLSQSEKTERLEIARARGQELENQAKLFQQRIDLLKQGDQEKATLVEQLGLIQEYQKQIKALREEQEKSRDVTRIKAINGEVAVLQAKLDELLGKTKGLKDATEDWKKQYEEIQRITTQFQINQDAFAIDEEERLKKSAEDRRKFLDDRLTDVQRAAQDEIDFNNAWKEELEDREREHQQRIQELREQGTQVAIDLVNALFEISTNRREEQFQQLAANEEAELRRVGDNEQAKEFIRNKFAGQERELKRRQAVSDKQQALFNIGINTLVAASKSLAQFGIPAGLVPAAIAVAQGAIQAAVVASKPIPAFKKGVINLQGPGTGTSDSILARLSKGESVMTHEETQRYTPTFMAIRHKKIDPLILNSVAQGKTPSFLIHNHRDFKRMESSMSMILEENRLLRKTMENLEIANVNIDKKGIHTYFRKGNATIEVLNNQFPY